jgi:negative regulator of flagellin synthesis FlgM
MANDITGINSNRPQLSTNQSAAAKSRNEAKLSNNDDESSPAAGDRVSLTSTASRLKDLEQQLNNTSPVDKERVAAMQAAISNGEYKVDADKVADKMLAFEDFMSN